MDIITETQLLLYILGGVLAGLALGAVSLVTGLIITARMRRETTQLIGNVQATCQAILAQGRREP